MSNYFVSILLLVSILASGCTTNSQSRDTQANAQCSIAGTITDNPADCTSSPGCRARQIGDNKYQCVQW